MITTQIMSSYILFLILGLGSGATYAILGQGLVLKYRSAGVVDFAHGAVAMFIAYVFVNLRQLRRARAARRPDPASDHAQLGGAMNTTLAIVDLARLRGDPRAGAVRARLPSAARRLAADAGLRVGRHHARASGDRGPQLQHRAGRDQPDLPVLAPISFSGITFPEDRLFFTGVVHRDLGRAGARSTATRGSASPRERAPRTTAAPR